MDNTLLDRGKYKNKTFKDVRINHTEYIIFLLNQPAGNVVHYFPFIKYCMDFLRLDVEEIEE